jgi:hypothetical protein
MFGSELQERSAAIEVRAREITGPPSGAGGRVDVDDGKQG